MNRKSKGFTLIELLVVISIISLLASIVTSSLSTARAKARDAKRISDIRQIQIALELYRGTTDGYPGGSLVYYIYNTISGLTSNPLDNLLYYGATRYISSPFAGRDNKFAIYMTEGSLSSYAEMPEPVEYSYILVQELENVSSASNCPADLVEWIVEGGRWVSSGDRLYCISPRK